MTEPHRSHDGGSIRSQTSASSSDSNSRHPHPHRSESQHRPRTSSTSISRSRSRRSFSPSDIYRVASGRYIDDQSVYYTEYNATRSSSTDSRGSRENESHEAADEKEAGPEMEIRGGVVNERDVDLEHGQRTRSNLEKSRSRKSERSQNDPTLVGESTSVTCLSSRTNERHRSPGKDRMIPTTRRIGLRRRNGVQS